MLPRLVDVLSDIGELAPPAHGASDDELELACADLSDAYMHLNVHPQELPHCFSKHVRPNVLILWVALCFGLSGAPLLWCRVAAALSRLIMGAMDAGAARLETYLDDPLWVLRGPRRQRDRQLALSLWLLLALGVQVAWHKAARGRQLTWIGAGLRLDHEARDTVIYVPAQMLREVVAALEELEKPGLVPLKAVVSLAGRLSWIAGLLPRLRWAVRVIYAVVAQTRRDELSGAERRRAQSRADTRVKRGLVASKRLALPARWLRFVLGPANGAPLVRRAPWDLGAPTLGVIVDASPWGLGGVLFHVGTLRPLEWFASALTPEEGALLGVPAGDSRIQQVAEALALLVALHAWGRFFRAAQGRVLARSDSTVALALLGKLASPSPALNFLAAEFGLRLEWSDVRALELEHIPGALNEVADALSRLSGPDPPAAPELLKGVKQRQVPPRDAQFFHFEPSGLTSTSGLDWANSSPAELWASRGALGRASVAGAASAASRPAF